eukprot:CCRYP_013691-RA/>CCRYP_013691-RA protein AED:0.02 eAED:0.02 QI:277/1/1/1/0/0/2/199/604
MKLLNSVKTASFRRSKNKRGSKHDDSAVQSESTSTQTPAAASSSATDNESASAAAAPASGHASLSNDAPPKDVQKQESPAVNDDARDVCEESALRPLRLGSFDFSTSYAFPSLFAEASSMLNLSLLIYTVSELRELARNGVLNDPTKSLRILQTPLPLETAFNIIEGEADLLQEVLSDGKHGSTLSSLQCILEAQKRKKEDDAKKQEDKVATVAKDSKESQSMFSGWVDSWNGCLAGGFSFDEIFCGGDLSAVDNGHKHAHESEKDNVESSMIYMIEDMRSNEELVYAIGVNPIEERITVVFRGSVTKVDYTTEAKIDMMHVPEPSGSDRNDMIGIHQGFYEYLFRSKSGKPSKYHEIMGHLQKLFRQDPNRLRHYKLYLTGHGLGGAIATLFGYYLASSSSNHQLPLPITVVSIASPRVGNVAFARSFTELESQAKLRHLRIANHKDPVTLRPISSSKHPLPLGTKYFSPLGHLTLTSMDNIANDGNNESFHHTGMKMKLLNEIPATTSQRCEVSYTGANFLSRAFLSRSPSHFDDKEDLEIVTEELKRSHFNNSLNGLSQDFPMLSYHYGEAYTERMSLVETDVSGLFLNQLYREKACQINC